MEKIKSKPENGSKNNHRHEQDSLESMSKMKNINSLHNVHPFSVIVGDIVFDGIIVVFEETGMFAVCLNEWKQASKDLMPHGFQCHLGFFELNGMSSEDIDAAGIVKECFERKAAKRIAQIARLMEAKPSRRNR